MIHSKKHPLILMILDGFGHREEKQHNAIQAAKTPQWDKWWESCPHTLLDASGLSVGLPNGQMGNSEVGHMHIGAGRVIPQDFTRINQAIETAEYMENPVFIELIEHLKVNNKALHIMGLLSSGGVHSHENHLFAFLALCQKLNFSDVYLHLFLDGRDTSPQSALASIEKLEKTIAQHDVGKIVSLTGRYYAMDRDQRWERIQPVYQLITTGLSNQHFDSAKIAIEHFYQQGIYDEFIPACNIGTTRQAIKDGDAVFFFNFRSDRARQLTQAFTDETFSGFPRTFHRKLSRFISMTSYGTQIKTQAAYPLFTPTNTLGDVLARHGLSQLRLAETEKYAHVTFFFNGGSEAVFPNEQRILIPSPQVATYDLKPVMSAEALTQIIVEAIHKKTYDVIICNYANADMVGHTGNFDAAVEAIEALDQAFYEIGIALEEAGGQLLITADHGNAECMFDESTQQPHTAHTNEPVPLLYVSKQSHWHFKNTHGSLIDIAPTILSLLGITPPPEMTGKNLLIQDATTHD